MLKKSVIYPTVLFFLIILAKFPTFNLNYHWDAKKYVSQAVYYAKFGFFTCPPGDILHFPLFLWILAFLYLFFGETPVISHFVMSLFSFLGIFFLYKLGKLLYNEKVGIVSSLLLFFSTIYFSISGQVLYDIPLVSLSIVTFYFGLKKDMKLYLIFAILLVSIKEPGFLVPLSFTLCAIFNKEITRKILYFALPLIVLVVWLLYEQVMIGTVLQSGMIVAQSLEISKNRFFANIYQITFWNYNWILSLFIFLFLSFKPAKFKEEFKKIRPMIMSSFLYFMLFTFAPIYSLPRYLLPITPVFVLLSSISMYNIFKDRLWTVMIILIVLFVSTYYWNTGIKGIIQDPVFRSNLFYPRTLTSIKSGELSLDYTDVIGLENELYTYVSKNYHNITIAIPYPIITDANLEVDVGYHRWRDYVRIVLPQNESDLFVDSSYTQLPKEYGKYLKQECLVKKFERNNLFIGLYKKDCSNEK